MTVSVLSSTCKSNRPFRSRFIRRHNVPNARSPSAFRIVTICASRIASVAGSSIVISAGKSSGSIAQGVDSLTIRSMSSPQVGNPTGADSPAPTNSAHRPARRCPARAESSGRSAGKNGCGGRLKVRLLRTTIAKVEPYIIDVDVHLICVENQDSPFFEV